MPQIMGYGFQEVAGWLTITGNISFSAGTRSFLKDIAWPVMKNAAMFYADFLATDPETGWLVSCPSNSPENGGLVSGPTMDHEIIKSLFKACIEASGILNTDKTVCRHSETIASRNSPL